jgi:nucleotide-binding universal stress UspA family protein
VNDVNPNTLVMGTIARTGLSGMIIGNTAEQVLGLIQTSVIAVKPEGFESPVTA